MLEVNGGAFGVTILELGLRNCCVSMESWPRKGVQGNHSHAR